MLDADSLARRGSFVTHRGVRLLVADASGLKGAEELAQIIGHVERLITGEPAGTVRIVIDVRHLVFDRASVGAVKGIFSRMQPYVRHTALIGVTGLLGILLQAINSVARRERPIFDALEPALDWLAEQP